MRLAILAASLLLAAPAFAADIPSCDYNAATPVLTECTADAYQAADKELNVVWQRALAAVVPRDNLTADDAAKWKASLVAAQKAWITYKEEDCNGAVAYEWFGGTGANTAINTCLYNHTVARTEDLRDRYLAQ